MSILTYGFGLVAAVVGAFLWTILTFIAVDQDDRILWRLAPGIGGVAAGLLMLIVGTLQQGLLVGALTAGGLLVAGRVLLDDFEVVRDDLRDDTP
jgi:hypothetical protein